MKQKVALLNAHNSICRYCDRRIESFADLEIDHIVPEHLSEQKRAELLTRIGEPDLDIQSYYNWVPVHGYSCNGRKSGTVFSDTALTMHLAVARDKVPAVEKAERLFDQQARSNNALARVARQIELGFLTKEVAVAFLDSIQNKPGPMANPVVLSFSVLLEDAQASAESVSLGEMLMSAAYKDGPSSSLIELLETALGESQALYVQTEAPENNGETLSVRYAMWLLDLDSLPKKFPDAWKLMQVEPYAKVYPQGTAEHLLDQAIILKRNDLVLDSESDDPLPYRLCPECGSRDLRRLSWNSTSETHYLVRCECGWADRI